MQNSGNRERGSLPGVRSALTSFLRSPPGHMSERSPGSMLLRRDFSFCVSYGRGLPLRADCSGQSARLIVNSPFVAVSFTHDIIILRDLWTVGIHIPSATR